MLSWAVSLVALAGAHASVDQSELSPRESEAWQHLQRGFATLGVSNGRGGTAALIDSSGLFIAHRSALSGGRIDGTLSNGLLLHFSPVAEDSLTKLVLLQAENWRSSYGTPLTVPDGDEFGHGMLFAVLQSGPIRAAFTKLKKAGFVQAERRIIPLNEVQFEAPAESCAGAMLVDEDGELLGVLGATLSRPGLQDSFVPPLGISLNPYRNPSYLPRRLGREPGGFQRMGPSDLMVAYSAGALVMKIVVNGFRGPDHRVSYPSIGLFCKDTPEGGALVQSVQRFSPADRSGLRPGDILISIGGEPIRDQVDFALVMLRQTAGSTIQVQFKRRNRSIVEDVSVGHS